MSQTSANHTDWFWRVLPAGTFVLGAVLGGVVIGLGAGGGDDPTSPGGGSSAAVQDGSASGDGGGGGDTTVVVPGACSEASAEVVRAISLIRDGVGAVQNFDPGSLKASLTELEDLDPRLRMLAGQCSAVQINPTTLATETPPGEQIEISPSLAPEGTTTPVESPTDSPTATPTGSGSPTP